jgi:L,D-transpeptidase catalytic domain/TAT (twin-arginine translocation) pathway signal sequence
MTDMNRRNLLKGTLALGALAALPARLHAQAAPGSVRDRKLFALAKEQLDKAGSVIWKHDVVGVADFGLRSSEPRFHFVHLEQQRVESFRVSHGTGSDPEHDGWLKNYSNVEGSNATSKGAYVTWEWYKGRYGTSVRLGGLDETNNNALQRYIVMHRAAYAEPEHLERYGRLGRSNGCFALSEEDFRTALLTLSGGRLLYADSLGWAEDGSLVTRPQPGDLALLLPEDPTGEELLNPGVY